jgi:hypothetical protein
MSTRSVEKSESAVYHVYLSWPEFRKLIDGSIASLAYVHINQARNGLKVLTQEASGIRYCCTLLGSDQVALEDWRQNFENNTVVAGVLSRLLMIKLFDMSSSDASYVGTAPRGSSAEDPAWMVNRISFDESGTPVDSLWAGPAKWSDRTALTYS